ncbi:putative ABC transport system permease protein [Alteromonadaceae bacterium Bs31]|nr:putative ABC transport system permease protein [Alteromonadaceae bacterium Bs31]
MKSTLILLWREFRSGELNILIFSLLLATSTVTSISLFTSRIQNSIFDEATEFLAADVQIRSTMAISPQWLQQAENSGLQTAQVQAFRAMAYSQQGMQLVAVKAVSSAYPLKGAVSLADTPFGEGQAQKAGPERGEAWLASRLFAGLELKLGDTIAIGDADFTVSKVLIKEPDSPQSFFGVAPRVMINLNDVPATGAIQTGSRVNYSLLLAGDGKNLKQFKNSIEKQLGAHARWVGVKDSNQNIGDALQRAEKFLLLAGSLSVMLSGVAIALAARRYAIRQSTNVALLKTFGQTPKNILQRYAIVLFFLGALSVFLGALIGWLLHWFILQIMGNLIPSGLAAPSPLAFLNGAFSGLVALLAFAAPPLLSLRKVAPAAVLRQGSANAILSPKIAGLIGFVSVCLLILVYSGSLSITAIITAGALVTLAGGGLLAWLLLSLGKIASQHMGNAWRLGIANLRRHQGFNTIQIVIFSSLIMLLLILVDTRTSLISQWQKQLPDKTPNHFIFNVFNDEKILVQDLLQQEGVERTPFYPMMRGRIIEVNGEPIKTRIENSSSRMNYERELNLTWATRLGDDNTVLEGQWHEENSNTLIVSAESEYAKGLNLLIGDTLTFSIAGHRLDASIGSFRSVQWDSMNPNFFMIFNRSILENSATNWLTSLYIPPERKDLLNKLTRELPTVTVLELDQMIDQVKGIISQVSLAIEFVLTLVLAAGLLVLITSIQATLDIRYQESAILRTLGAQRALVNKVLLIEFCSLGFMAGFLGAIGAQISLYFLQTHVFSLDYSINPLLILAGPAFGCVLIGTIGWLSTRKVTYQPPLSVLRSLN